MLFDAMRVASPALIFKGRLANRGKARRIRIATTYNIPGCRSSYFDSSKSLLLQTWCRMSPILAFGLTRWTYSWFRGRRTCERKEGRKTNQLGCLRLSLVSGLDRPPHLQAEGGLERLIGHLRGELLHDCLVGLVLRHDVDRRRFQGACDNKRIVVSYFPTSFVTD